MQDKPLRIEDDDGDVYDRLREHASRRGVTYRRVDPGQAVRVAPRAPGTGEPLNRRERRAAAVRARKRRKA
jgi:hypothetical protein